MGDCGEGKTKDEGCELRTKDCEFVVMVFPEQESFRGTCASLGHGACLPTLVTAQDTNDVYPARTRPCEFLGPQCPFTAHLDLCPLSLSSVAGSCESPVANSPIMSSWGN